MISNYGNVKKLIKGEWVNINPKFYACDYTGAGYLSVALDSKHCRIHRLVAENFIENPLNKPEVDHIDGNRFNNHVDNLRWATRAENAKNASKRNVFKGFKGDSDIQFLTESTLLLSGFKIIEISKMMKRDRAEYSRMFNSDKEKNRILFKSRTFYNLFGDLMRETKNKYHKETLKNRSGSHARKLTDEQIIEIRKSNMMIKDLAKIYNVSTNTISRHKNSK